MKINSDAIPLELRELRRWVVWCWGEIDPKTGKPRKPPFPATAPGGSRHASNQEPEDWTTYERAVAVVEADKADGIGIALEAEMGITFVDLDEGLPEADRAAIVLALDSYTERSPSGIGMHVLVRGSLNGSGKHPGGIGVFDDRRFVYFTGQHVPGTPMTIEDRQVELDEVLAHFLPTKPVGASAHAPTRPVDLDDREILEKAFAAKNVRKFRRLWEGDSTGYESESEADIALCRILAFWTQKDADQIDRLLRSSGLWDDKWERTDYREKTIKKAIDATTEVYDPEPSERSQGSDAADSDTSVLGATGWIGVAESALKDSATPDAAAPTVSEVPRPESNSDPDADAADSGPDQRPFALPVHEFISREREQRKPMLADADGRAVIGFLSLVLLGALGGHGKTTLGVDLFLHMAAGVDYPPFTVPRPVSILLIENEGPEQLFADKLAARLEHFPHELQARLDVCMFDWGGFSLADETHRERLTSEIAEKGYDLVFGDPLDSLGIEGVGSPEDTRKFLALMKQTGLNKTVAWWLNTHPRKEETREALNEISGAWGGKPDTVFLLRMLENDRTQIRQPKLRWARRGKGPTLLYAFDPETEAFSFIGEQSEDERDFLAEIRGLLKDGAWRIVKEISAPVEAGGIAANDKIVKTVLEQHPDVFASRTGDEARALGRKPQAILWQLRANETTADADEQISLIEIEAATIALRERTGQIKQPLEDAIAEARRMRDEPTGDEDE